MVLLSLFIFYRLLFSALYILFGISVLMVVVCWCVKLRKKFRIRRQKQAKNSPSKEVARLLQRSLQFTLQNFVNFTRVVGQTDASVLTSGLQGCNRGTREATKTKQRAPVVGLAALIFIRIMYYFVLNLYMVVVM